MNKSFVKKLIGPFVKDHNIGHIFDNLPTNESEAINVIRKRFKEYNSAIIEHPDIGLSLYQFECWWNRLSDETPSL